MNADSHDPAVDPTVCQPTPHSHGPEPQKRVWVRILDDDEAERKMEENGFPHLSTRRLNWQAETKFATEAVDQISQALEHPPARKGG